MARVNLPHGVPLLPPPPPPPVIAQFAEISPAASPNGVDVDAQGDVDVDMDKISSKFGWDHKSVLWEVLNMSVAVGRGGGGGHPEGNNLNLDPDPSDPVEYACLLDIDYMTSLPFQAGQHEKNKSTWSLSFYKTSPEYLGLYLHLLEVNDGGESSINRRFHHNHSFDDYNHAGHQGHGLYVKYAMSVVTPEGEVVHKVENDSIINLLPGQSWGEEDFILISNLWDGWAAAAAAAGGAGEQQRQLAEEKLLVRVDLWLFSQLNHVHDAFGEASQTTTLSGTNFSKDKPFARLQTRKQFGGFSGEGGKPGTLECLWNQRDFADVQIICGDRTFAVHKCIISAVSPVFKAMFSTAMSESLNNTVTLHDLCPTVLEALLAFMYNQAPPPTWNWNCLEKSADLINAAEKYELKELKGLAFAALCDKMDLTTAPGVAILAQVYAADSAVKECVAKFIIRNLRRLKLEPSFNDLVLSHPAAFAGILLSDALSKSVSSTCL